MAAQTQVFRATPPTVAKRAPKKEVVVDIKARTVTRKQHAPDDIGALKVMFESGHHADPRQTLRDAHATVQLLAALVGGPGGPVVQGALISLRGAIEAELDRAVRGTAGSLDELAAKAKHTHALVTAALGRES
ncbi:MAG: hypothetical protein JKY37_22480 [Nannocystaceae bacterium]|nr:hypothetical protein [Nannocystaceae bacterium]